MGTAKLLANDYSKNSFACSGDTNLIQRTRANLSPDSENVASQYPLLKMWSVYLPTVRDYISQVASSYKIFKTKYR